jgi:hypothetical protein
MKVKVIGKNLDDLQDKVFRPVGSIFECSEERAEYLLKNKAIEIVEEEPKSLYTEIIKNNKKKKSSKK